MWDASFGPVLLVAAYRKSLRSFTISLIPLKMSYIINIIYNTNNNKKDMSFGPVLLIIA